MDQAVPLFEDDETHPSCHCATLAELPDASLLAAWYAGSYETAPDVVIKAARWQPELGSWSRSWIIADTPGKSDGQPVLLAHPDGTLWLLYVTIEGSGWTSARMKYRVSTDQGRTWSEETVLPFPAGMMFRSKPLMLRSGVMVVPVYDEKTWSSSSMISEDGGLSWHLGEPIITPPGNIQPCIVPRADGRLLAYLRTGGAGGHIWRATSSDNGWNWSQAHSTSIPNPNAGIDLIRLQTGHLVLAFNHSSTARTPLNVALSTDEGMSWVWLRTIAERASEAGDREYSYPTVLQTRDGVIHLVYTHERVQIRHLAFTEGWLEQGLRWDTSGGETQAREEGRR